MGPRVARVFFWGRTPVLGRARLSLVPGGQALEDDSLAKDLYLPTPLQASRCTVQGSLRMTRMRSSGQAWSLVLSLADVDGKYAHVHE
jgi:hypothetical protein